MNEQHQIGEHGGRETTAKKIATATKDKRTGFRKPKNYLKMWRDKDWSTTLTTRLHVGMVDEDLPPGKEGGRKSWYLSLTQPKSVAKTAGKVGLPKGNSLVLFEDDVVALAVHLLNTGLIEVDDDVIYNGLAREEQMAQVEKKRRRRKSARSKAAKRPVRGTLLSS